MTALPIAEPVSAVADPNSASAPAGSDSVSAVAGSSSMTAHAAVEVDRHRGTNRIVRLRSDGPFRVRPSGPKGVEPWIRGSTDAARVSVSAATAGPLGGDRLRFDVTVGDGATLVLNDISATLVLPGVHGEPSTIDYRIRLGDDATLIWLSEPIIAAAGCDHHHRIVVDLADSARLFLRDDLVAGRIGEASGDLALSLRIVRLGRPLLDQSLVVGDRHAGWAGPAVLDGARAVGTMVIVDPGSSIGRDRIDLIGDTGFSTGLADDVVSATVTAADSLVLSRGLERALALVGSPWAPEP